MNHFFYLKKSLCVLLSALLCAACLGCSAGEAPAPAETPEAAETAAPTEAPEVSSAPSGAPKAEAPMVNGHVLTAFSAEEIATLAEQANAIVPEDFTLPLVGGGEASLSDFSGKVTVLNCLGSWCGYCVAELPHFQEAYELYGGEVNFVGVDTFETGSYEAAITPVLSEAGITFPVFLDESDKAGWYFSPRGSLPVTLFLDQAGVVRFYYGGAVSSADDLIYLIDFLLQHSDALPAVE